MEKSTFQVYLHANIGIRNKKNIPNLKALSFPCLTGIWGKISNFFINEIPSTKFKFFFTSPEWCWLVPTFHLCYEKWMFRLRVIKLVLMVFFLQHLNLLLLWLLLLALVLVLPVKHQFIAILNEHLKSFWFRFLFFPPHIYCWFFIFVLLIH